LKYSGQEGIKMGQILCLSVKMEWAAAVLPK